LLPTPIYRRELLPAGARLSGPAVIEEVGSTVLVHPGDGLDVDALGLLMISS
jgi:N-methylhydantoinase A